MITTNTNFDAKHNVDYKTPLYLIHFDGETTDYCNHKCTSPDNTLKRYLKSIKGLAQQDVPEEGQSTIEGVTIELVDYDQAITALIATDTTSYFQRRKVTVKAGYAGMAESDLISILPAGYVTGLKYNRQGGSWVFEITDPRKVWDRNIFRGAEDSTVTLSGNPIDIFLGILMSSGTPGTNHAFHDRYADGVGLDLDTTRVNVTAIEAVRDDWFPGSSHYMEFTVDDRETAGSWFKKEIFKPLNLRPGIDGTGKIVLRRFAPPLATSDETQTFTKDNIIGHPSFNANLGGLINEVKFSYDHDGSDYQTIDYHVDASSMTNRGPGKKQIEIESKGLHSSISARSIPVAQITDIVAGRARAIFARYAKPPVQIDCECFFDQWLSEAGDIVELTHEDLPDMEAGTLGYTNRRMEILNRRVDWIKGRVNVTLLDTGFDQGTYAVISPTMTVTAGTDGENFTVSTADAAKYANLTAPEVVLYDSKMRARAAHVTLLTVNTSTGACTCDALGVTPAAGDVIAFANYDDATTEQQLFGYIADSSNDLGTANDDAHLIAA